MITWLHDEDYEEQANRLGYTLGRMGKEFKKRYDAIFHEYMYGYMTYTQYIKALKDLEKDLNRYAEVIKK